MPSTSALNPAPSLADLQRGGAQPPPLPPSTTPQHPAFGQSLRRRRRSSHSSHDSHDSHGSHESHSSHSSYAARHPDRVPQKAASPNKAFLSVLGLLGLILAYTLIGAWLFIKGFLLTRHELDGWNECAKPAEAGWTLPRPPERLDDEAVLSWADTVLDAEKGEGECRMVAGKRKAVVLVIDALRYDFIAPTPMEGGSVWEPNPYYHNILTLPAELTAKHGIPAFADRPGPTSFLAHFAADPPTTTLQRLKGLTTGTLPTFVEAGANFGSAGTGVGQVNEDNWISQFRRSILNSSSVSSSAAGLVFAGDDTWSTVFPNLFDADKTWSYDSFNVEDLDTVDRGVEAKLMPFLQQNHPERVAGVHDSWRLLVGHTLGVDHVGHRYGAGHPKMKVKLEEMQDLLRNVTEAVDEETLVVVMGDHGMDERGDHGGDAELEVGAGIWIYSKGGFGHTGRRRDLRQDPAEYVSTPEVESILPSRIPFSSLPSPPYPSTGHRTIPQIDLVPTISVLLGLPIPYNNLGSIIPDLFAHPDTLLRALRITSRQMREYLSAYSRRSPDLAAFQPEFDRRWLEAVRADADLARLLYSKSGAEEVEEAWRAAARGYHAFNRVSLVRAREVWAQFDAVRIVVGLVVMVLGLGVAWVVRCGAMRGLVGVLPAVAEEEEDGEGQQDEVVRRSRTTEELYAVVWRCVARSTLVGAGVGAAVHGTTFLPLPLVLTSILKPLTLVDTVLTGASVASSLSLVLRHLPSTLAYSAQRRLLRHLGWFIVIISFLPVPLALTGMIRSPTLSDAVLTCASVVFSIPLLFRALPSTPQRPASQANDNDNAIPSTTRLLNSLGWVVVLIHTALFASNSLLVFEDRFVLLTLASLLLIRGLLLVGSSPTTRLRLRHIFLTLLSLILVRLAAIPRVCREEQAPHCTNTFFASSSSTGSALNSPYIIALAYIIAYLLPDVVGRVLAQNKSFVGIAPGFFRWVVRPTLMIGAGQWALDYAVPLDSVQASGWGGTLEWLKYGMVKVDLVWIAVAVVFWVFAPLCLEIRRETTQAGEGGEEGKQQQKVTILGFANSFGSSLTLMLGVGVSLIWLTTQPSGQVGLGLGVVVGMVCVEMGDAERDVVVLFRQKKAADETAQTTPSSPIHLSSTEIVAYTLLSQLLFFSTGHQATFASIQWRTAFLTSPTLTYPLSPLLVLLNSFGTTLLLPSLLTALSVLWNTAPLPRGSNRRMSTPQQLLSALATLALINGIVLVGTAGLSGLVFRRHLMLFKVWTPRVLVAVVNGVGGQVVAVAVTTAVWQVANKVGSVFGSEFA
ncbi:phosphoethanolamine N-methyltransferase [Pseudozyma hubeiensis SY62]|uniref:Phosphoethanolamine N-methyltransferase n=1 Tax=Pseudozyma hubeiensis (strain SY62) TaxID=1305764 RepID=R9NYQ6_PSEHS|nr:phosphoethanolamine N-methyltransferase [Pseudozyma hubeiensis SY62]GAC93839.1 phosphoethanolamine N-methyltransferase [Pseudozyma hubeiensis SY62]